MPSTLETLSGNFLDIENPNPDFFNIDDIAYSLAREYRFSNQTHFPYSVAEHSIYACLQAKEWGWHKQDQRAALMHDAAEAYLRDIPHPLKQHLPEYKRIEDIWIDTIFERFGVTGHNQELINLVDRSLGVWEAEFLLKSKGAHWPKDYLNSVEPITIEYDQGLRYHAGNTFVLLCDSLGIK